MTCSLKTFKCVSISFFLSDSPPSEGAVKPSGPDIKSSEKLCYTTTFFYRGLSSQEKMMLLYLLIAFASAGTYQFHPYNKSIPTKYCILKNCHNCARSFNYNFGTQESRAVCTAMYQQAGCCDFYIKRSRGILF